MAQHDPCRAFTDFVDHAVHSFSLEGGDHFPEHQEFFHGWHQEAMKGTRFNLPGQYTDAFGDVYMELVSRYKSKALGQYFTPPNICSMISRIVEGEPRPGEKVTVNDPACGSGRMPIDFCVRYMAKGGETWLVANDLDPLCAKMTAVNMAINGVMGEVTCNDGLWSSVKNYRFGYLVMPMSMLLKDQPGWSSTMRILLAGSASTLDNMYSLVPLEAEKGMMVRLHERDIAASNAAVAAEKQKEAEAKRLETLQKVGYSLFDLPEEPEAGSSSPPSRKQGKPVPGNRGHNNNQTTLF